MDLKLTLNHVSRRDESFHEIHLGLDFVCAADLEANRDLITKVVFYVGVNQESVK